MLRPVRCETYQLPTIVTNCSNNYGPCRADEPGSPGDENRGFLQIASRLFRSASPAATGLFRPTSGIRRSCSSRSV